MFTFLFSLLIYNAIRHKSTRTRESKIKVVSKIVAIIVGIVLGYFFGYGSIEFRKIAQIEDQNVALDTWAQGMLNGLNINFHFFSTLNWSSICNYKVFLCLSILMIMCSVILYFTMPELKDRPPIRKTGKIDYAGDNPIELKDRILMSNFREPLPIIDSSYENLVTFGIFCVLLQYIHNNLIVMFLFVFFIFSLYKFETKQILHRNSNIFWFENDARHIELYKLSDMPTSKLNKLIFDSKYSILKERRLFFFYNSIPLLMLFVARLYANPVFILVLLIIFATFFLLFPLVVLGELKTFYEAFCWVKRYNVDIKNLKIFELSGFNAILTKNTFFYRIFTILYFAICLMGASGNVIQGTNWLTAIIILLIACFGLIIYESRYYFKEVNTK
jgi:hypothetical protein